MIYYNGDTLPDRVDVEFKSILESIKPTVFKNIGMDNSSYNFLGTGE